MTHSVNKTRQQKEQWGGGGGWGGIGQNLRNWGLAIQRGLHITGGLETLCQLPKT